MIQASSLRIGNLVNYKRVPIICSISEITEEEIKVLGLHHKCLLYLTEFEPIPLTPEWLERAGFEHLEKTNVWINQIALYQNDTVFMYEVNLFEDSELIPIHYVHTLQNLYFAFTNKELEFNLDNLN